MRARRRRSLVGKAGAAARWGLSLLMLSGNPSALVGMLLASPLRLGVPAFLAAWSASARMAFAFPDGPKVIDLRRGSIDRLDLCAVGPSDGDLFSVDCLEERLVPGSSPASEGENRELVLALKKVLEGDEAAQALEDFTAARPASRWTLSVEFNRGMLLYRQGYFSKSLGAFRAAWEAGKGETDPRLKNLADRALGEMIRMVSRVGRMEDLAEFLDLMKTRRPQGTAGRLYQDGKDSLWAMRNDPGKAFFCGPYALQNILRFQGSPKAKDGLFQETRSPREGFSLDQVRDLSARLGMGYQAAKRASGAPVILPCVVNWRVEHYAALVEEKDGMIHSVDPTFGGSGEAWITKAALDEEGSGYFLVPEGTLPQGWMEVDAQEAATVWGKGITNGNLPQTPPCATPDGCHVGPSGPPPQEEDSSCSEGGEGSFMPEADIDLYLAAAMIKDTPLWYQSALGSKVNFTLTYHQKTANDLPFSGFGPQWSFNWQGFIAYELPPPSGGGAFDACTLAPVGYYVAPPGGGQEPFTPGGTTQFTHSRVTVTQTGLPGCPGSTQPVAFLREHPNGRKEVYDRAIVSLDGVKVLLTKVIDPRGHEVILGYDSLNRLATLTDATGRVTQFTYGGSDTRILRVTEPSGRHADFTYDGSDRLASITDLIGLTTIFTYNPPSALASDWVGSMTTPYGTTTFDYTGSQVDGVHELEITDPAPLLSKRHGRFTHDVTLPGETASIPAGLPPANGGPNGVFLQYRNTLYWDKQAMAQAPLDMNSAKIYHWLHTTDNRQAAALESVKNPLESRIWYSYAGQDNSIFEAAPNMPPLPTLVTRMVLNPGGSEGQQDFRYIYNALGKVTAYTDPKGREFTYSYAPNGIDLLEVRAGSHSLASYGGYVNHQPSTHTDAAGKTWNYFYNGDGQLESVAAPNGETTGYHYDFLKRLDRVTPPQPGAGVTFTYESLVPYRVHTREDAVNGVVTFTYDDGDRVTRVDYPDGSNETYAYDKLDVVDFKDRNDRHTTFAYDSQRHLTSVTDPKFQTTQYGWCSCGSLESIKDPKNNTTTFTRDVEGRVTRKQYQDGSHHAYNYDRAGGRLLFTTDPNNNVARYSYDLDDKLVGVDYTSFDSPTSGVTMAYNDPLGRLTSVSDGTGTHLYNYVPFGQTGGGNLQSVSQPVGASTAEITYQYDDNGRVTGKSIDGVAETYGFNNGQLTNVVNPLGGFSYSYNPLTSQLSNVQYPNGQAVTFDYYGPAQNSGRLKEIKNLDPSAQVLSKFNYDYNPSGEIVSWGQQLSNNVADAKAYGIGYDAASQLAGVTLTSGASGFNGLTAGQSVSYSYDAAGNRTHEQAPAFDHSFGTNNLNQLTNITPDPIVVKGGTDRPSTILVNGVEVEEDDNNEFRTTVLPAPGATTPLTVRSIDKMDGTAKVKRRTILNTQPFTYDANGNLVQDQEKSYDWDAANRLIRVSYLNALPPTVADTITFQYDGLSRRVGITEKHGSTVLSDKRFVWCGAELCEERSANGSSVTKRYFKNGFQITSGATQGNYFYSRDHIGSIREVSDSSGTVRARYDFDAFGRQTKLVGDLDADFGYTGFYVNKASGLDLTWFRAYSPEMGRWLSRDPLGEAEGANLYMYAFNSPGIYWDRYGLKAGAWWDWLASYKRATVIAEEELNAFSGHHNDAGDAMRHATWSNRVTCELGPYYSYFFGVGHELKNLSDSKLKALPQTFKESLMDSHNNAEGRNAGQDSRAIDPENLWTSPQPILQGY